MSPGFPALTQGAAAPAVMALEAWQQIQIRTVPSRQWPQMAPFTPDPAPSSRPNGPYECLTRLIPDPAPSPPMSSGRANTSLTPGPEAGLACASLPTQALQGSVLHQPGSPLLKPLSPFSAQLKCPPLPHRALAKPLCPRPLSWSPHTVPTGWLAELWRARCILVA